MIEINQASIDKLIEVKGIGEVTATNIVDYREKNGDLQNLEELKQIKGIGDITFAQIKSELTISEKNAGLKKPESETSPVTISFDPEEVGIAEPDEVHLVGEMNDWNPADKSYSLQKNKDGTWSNEFNLKPGTEYKIMYDSSSWEEKKHIGFYGENFQV